MHYYLGNLKPSEALYLQENVMDAQVAEKLQGDLVDYLKEQGKCIASLDEVFCNAAMLRPAMDQLSDDVLGNVFQEAVNSGSSERAAAFLDALGQKRDNIFRPMVGVARKF